MECLPLILCVGEDLDLLSTRARLLRRLDADVKWTTSVAGTVGCLHDGTIDVLVLCHTLKEAEAIAICNAARQQAPSPLVLQIRKSFEFNEDRAHIPFDGLVDTHPAALTDAVAALLARRAARSKSPSSESNFRERRSAAGHR